MKLKIKDLPIYDEYSAAAADVSLKDGASVMIKESTYYLVVAEGQKPLGLISPDELIEAIASGKNPEQTTLKQIMTEIRRPVQADMDLDQVVREFIDSKEAALPVVENNKLIGLVTLPDVIAGIRRASKATG